MRYQKHLTKSVKLKAILPTITAALLLSSCQSVPVNDVQFCAPIYGLNPDNSLTLLATECDNFLTSNKLSLTPEQWQSYQVSLVKQNIALECTTSISMGNLKKEIEKLCGVAKCSYSQKTALVNGFAKLQSLGLTQTK